ncbi:MAG: transposase [Patescibacteria group bacterium]
MYNKMPHRNSQKRFYGKDKIYFIVTKTYKNHPYFQEPIFCDLLIEEIKLCKGMKKFKLYAFSIIYDHLNLLIKPGEEYNISKVMQSIKKETARDINYIYNDKYYNQNNEGDIPECRLQGMQYSQRKKQHYYTPKLAYFQKRFANKYNYNNVIQLPQFKWQKSFHDHIIRNNKDYINHHNYTVYNHLKHKLPENWRYTSLNFPEMVDNFFE